MTIIYVNFVDSTRQTVQCAFAGPQNPEIWTNQGEIEDHDPRYLAFIDPSGTSEGQWAAYQGRAFAALTRSDAVMTRTAEAVALGLTSWGAHDVAAYAQWRRDLRAIVRQSEAPPIIPAMLPTMPAYPAGT